MKKCGTLRRSWDVFHKDPGQWLQKLESCFKISSGFWFPFHITPGFDLSTNWLWRKDAEWWQSPSPTSEEAFCFSWDFSRNLCSDHCYPRLPGSRVLKTQDIKKMALSKDLKLGEILEWVHEHFDIFGSSGVSCRKVCASFHSFLLKPC